jgi:cytochrome c-type biogenesis protein CcmH/NrfG
MLKKLAGADAENVKKQLDEMGPDIQEASALNKWILAGFYEQNKLYIDALTSLSEAHRLAPDVPEIKEAYEDFLARHGYKK